MLKLRSVATAFYPIQPRLTADGVTYEECQAAFLNRSQDKHTDPCHYARVQNASQEKDESHEIFLDCLRQRTIRCSKNPVEQAVINPLGLDFSLKF